MTKKKEITKVPAMPCYPASRPINNTTGFVDWGIIVIIFLIVAFLFLLNLTSCTGPGKLIDTGYIVGITENNQTDIYRFSNSARAEIMINDSAGICIEINELLGKKNPFFELKNSELFIYVEKKGIYEKNGKIKWRVYDEQLK